MGAPVLAGLVFVPPDRASGARKGAHKRNLDLAGTLLLTAVLLQFVGPLLWSTSSPASTHLVPRFGRRVLVAGLAAMILGLSALAWLLSGDPDPWTLAPALLVAGLGMGLVVAPTLDLGLADVPAHLAGTASGLLNNAQHVAGAAGIGVLGDLYAATEGMGPTLIGVVALLALALPATRLLPRLGKPAEMSEAGRSVPCDRPHNHRGERS